MRKGGHYPEEEKTTSLSSARAEVVKEYNFDDIEEISHYCWISKIKQLFSPIGMLDFSERCRSAKRKIATWITDERLIYLFALWINRSDKRFGFSFWHPNRQDRTESTYSLSLRFNWDVDRLENRRQKLLVTMSAQATDQTWWKNQASHLFSVSSIIQRRKNWSILQLKNNDIVRWLKDSEWNCK